MSQQILWFEKSKIDLEQTSVSITVTDSVATNNGQSFVDFMRDRKNYTAWMTTDSTDAALTQLDIALVDPVAITDILLVGHNLKNYTIQYKIGAGAYTDFSTVINPTNDTNDTTAYNFTEVSPTDIRIIINGTQTADADKIIKQLIITNRLGQFTGFPEIKNLEIDTSKRTTKMISGKVRVVETLEAFSCTLNVGAWNIQADLDLVKTIYEKREGVLMWLNANDADQFGLDLKGYRKQDIFLVRPTDELRHDFVRGIYTNPVKMNMRFAEVIT